MNKSLIIIKLTGCICLVIIMFFYVFYSNYIYHFRLTEDMVGCEWECHNPEIVVIADSPESFDGYIFTATKTQKIRIHLKQGTAHWYNEITVKHENVTETVFDFFMKSKFKISHNQKKITFSFIEDFDEINFHAEEIVLTKS